jgi:hypothetical protein
MDPRQTVEAAEGFWVVGASHAWSAQQLAEIEPTRAFNGGHSASIFLLVGFALELTLKGVFVALGGTPEAAKKKMGHDLLAALQGARDQGWTGESPQLGSLITAMREAHRINFFRYMGMGDSIILPDLPPSLLILDDHVRRAGLAIWPDAAPQWYDPSRYS